MTKTETERQKDKDRQRQRHRERGRGRGRGRRIEKVTPPLTSHPLTHSRNSPYCVTELPWEYTNIGLYLLSSSFSHRTAVGVGGVHG